MFNTTRFIKLKSKQAGPCKNTPLLRKAPLYYVTWKYEGNFFFKNKASVFALKPRTNITRVKCFNLNELHLGLYNDSDYDP